MTSKTDENQPLKQDLKTNYDGEADSYHPWEEEHLNMQDGGLRAAVFGFNDGLVTNTCLICGVGYGHGMDMSNTVITGVAGLLAGAISMCVGEWLSMTAQSEGLEHELETERRHIKLYPEEEDKHLVEILRDHGFKNDAINAVMKDLANSTVETRLSLHAHLELNIDPDDLGSPLKAAVFSFCCFSIGAFIPLLPWLIFSTPNVAFWSTLIFVLLISILTGFIMSSKSPKPWYTLAARQVIVLVIAVGLSVLLNWVFQKYILS